MQRIPQEYVEGYHSRPRPRLVDLDVLPIHQDAQTRVEDAVGARRMPNVNCPAVAAILNDRYFQIVTTSD